MKRRGKKPTLQLIIGIICYSEAGEGGVSKSVKCPHCKEYFPTENEAAKHLETHTADTYCILCDKYFQTVYTYRTHLQNVHQEGEFVHFYWKNILSECLNRNLVVAG